MGTNCSPDCYPACFTPKIPPRSGEACARISRGCRTIRLRTRMHARDIGACDHTARIALHSQPGADPAFVRRAPFAERGDGCSGTAAAACGRKNEALADRMMLGKLPSRPMTCRRDTASVLPTTSSMFFGRYFSTCRSTEAEASYMNKILDTVRRFRMARHLINVLRPVLVRLQQPTQSRYRHARRRKSLNVG